MLGNRRDRLTRARALVLAHPARTAAILLIVGFGLRLVEVERAPYRPIGDARSYLSLATQVARSGDYSGRDGGAGSTIGPTAYFAPGLPFLLAFTDLLTGDSRSVAGTAGGARITEVLIGTLIVGLIGLVASELFGVDLALLSMALAAIYPALIELSTVVTAENLLTALMLAAIYAALRARRAHDPMRWTGAAGILIGLASLTHANGIVLALPLAFAVRGLRTAVERRPLPAPALLIAVALATVAPWVIRDAVDLHTFVPVTDEAGITLAGTYNPVSAAAEHPPWKWRFYGDIPADHAIARIAASLTEPELDGRLEHQALDYIGAHPLAPLEVAADNTLRLLELEGSAAWRASAASIGIPLGFARFAVASFWVLALLAAAGLFTRPARGLPRWLWAIPVLLWLSVVLVNAETPRFREPLEPFLVMLAACGLAGIVGGRSADRDRLRGERDAAGDGGHDVLAGGG